MIDSAIRAVLSLCAGHRRFVLTTHINPDGDGLGSEIALAEWLRSQGKEVHILNNDATPQVYRFLDAGQNLLLRYQPGDHAGLIAGAEVIMVLDTNHPGRLESLETAVMQSRARRICIDHHLDPSDFADLYVVDQSASSTGEIAYRLLKEAGQPITSTIATALYCAIVTDTGSFRYSNVDPELHRIVADLIGAGADPAFIYRQVYEQWTPGRIRLLGETLATLKTEYDGALAHVTIDQTMLRRTGTHESDTDTFTVYPMSVQGVEAAILFLELGDGVKMSLRSRNDIPVNELAQEFGGNGHKNAAGARVRNEALGSFRERVIRAAGKYLHHVSGKP